MKRILFSVVAVICVASSGCGGAKDKGPASESQTPQVSKEEVEQKMTQGMPDNAKKMYDQYKKGGTPRP